VSVLKAGTNWEVQSMGDLGEQVISTPVLANGCVIIRTEKTLFAFGSRTP
jgi:hypothetical protein